MAPPLREAHIRDDSQTHDGNWTALCGEVHPATSFSEAHARLVLAGKMAGTVVLTMCPQCETVLRDRMETLS
jgi:heterodisulfide reductase subunit B